MKEGWEYKTLGEVANVIHGKNQKEVLSENGKYPIYGSGGTIMGYATDFLCPAGTTILGRKGTINNPLYIEEDFWNVDTAFGISAKENVSSKFVYYYCRNKDWGKLNTGTTLPSLTQSVVKSQIIPIPRFTKQEEIVSYLDTTFANIEKLKSNASKALSEAKALFQAALAEAMMPKDGWEETTLGKVCFIARGGSPRPIKNYITEDVSGIPWIKIGDAEMGGKYIYETKERIKKDGIKSSRYVKYGDFLLSNSMSFGRPYILKTDGCIHDGWLVLQNFRDTFFDDFLYYLLSSKIVQKQFDLFAYGATVRNLNTESVSKVIVSYPIKSQQHKIVRHLDSLSSKVRQMEENYRKTLAECDALKQAILRDVFE